PHPHRRRERARGPVARFGPHRRARGTGPRLTGHRAGPRPLPAPVHGRVRRRRTHRRTRRTPRRLPRPTQHLSEPPSRLEHRPRKGLTIPVTVPAASSLNAGRHATDLAALNHVPPVDVLVIGAG